MYPFCLSKLTFQLSHNEIKELPPSLFQSLINLTGLNLQNNQLVFLPELLFCTVTKLESLRINGNRFRGLPNSLFQLTNLTFLDLSMNPQIGEAPRRLSALTNLQALEMTNIRMSRSLPYFTMAPLTKLQRLNLSQNRLQFDRSKEDDKAFLTLTRLEWLNLNFAQLTGLPYSIFVLTNLVTLHLNGNKLGSCGSRFSSFTRLKHLHLKDNRIKELYPDQFFHLTALETLHLSENPFQYIPNHMFDHHQRLQEIDLDPPLITKYEIDKTNLPKTLHIITTQPQYVINITIAKHLFRFVGTTF